MYANPYVLGKFGDERLAARGNSLLSRMVAQESTCLRRLAGGVRSAIVGFTRFLAHSAVTVEKIIEGWGPQTGVACMGKHVLAIQDTSEINFATTKTRHRGLGEIGKGVGRGVLLHAMIGVDAETGGLLGLVSGQVRTRKGRVTVPHGKRPLGEKESYRWVSTAQAAKKVLTRAAMVTEISDRESDIYEKWAHVPGPDFHVLTRADKDRRIKEGGGKLSSAPLSVAGQATLELPNRAGQAARTVQLVARFGRVTIKRPSQVKASSAAATVEVSLVEVMEVGAPKGVKPILWRLLTTHRVEDAAMAWLVSPALDH